MKGILFNQDMVRAILDGRKTVTRRVVKLQELDWEFCGMENDPYMTRIDRNGEEYPSKETGLWAAFEWEAEFPLVKAPYQPGQILYVRETWAPGYEIPHKKIPYSYKADNNDFVTPRWHPSIHMPREAARIFLRVTDVRVERLQDITEEQAVKEGFEAFNSDSGYYEPATLGFVETWYSTIKKADRALYGWEANPYVWCVSFERISKEEAYALHKT